MRLSSTTGVRSQCRTVESRCAIAMRVQASASSESLTCFCVLLSSALVASSSGRMRLPHTARYQQPLALPARPLGYQGLHTLGHLADVIGNAHRLSGLPVFDSRARRGKGDVACLNAAEDVVVDTLPTKEFS